MDLTIRKKLQDIKKLMEAAGTIGEAEAAATAMQRLVLKHNLTTEDLTSLGKSTKEEYEAGFIRVAPDRKPGIQWRLNLLYVLAEYNFCAFIRLGHHGATGYVVGQPSNQEAVRTMFESTVGTVEKLSESEWYYFRNDLRWFRTGCPTATAWKNSFKLGFSAGLRIKMGLERKNELDQIEGASALVLVKDHELKEAVEENLGKVVLHKGSAPTNTDGYYRGIEKGREHELQNRLS